MTGAAQVDSCLLTLSVIAVLLPAAFHNALQPTGGTNPAKNPSEVHDLLSISYGVCIFLLCVSSALADGCSIRLLLSCFSVSLLSESRVTPS